MPRSENVGPRLSIWEADRLVVMVAGVGKVAAAIAAQYACDVYNPRCMIAIGLAGAVRAHTRPGQVIVALGAVQHDMDARPLTDARGIVPGLGMQMIPANPAVAETLLRAARYRSEDALSGLVLTGDQIVTSRGVRDALARDFPQAACIDMETAALAQVAHQNGVDRKSTRLNSSHANISYAVFCLKKKNNYTNQQSCICKSRVSDNLPPSFLVLVIPVVNVLAAGASIAYVFSVAPAAELNADYYHQ